MQATPAVDTPIVDTGTPAEYFSRIEKALELIRTDAVLHELDDGTPQTAQRKRLIAWYASRRAILARDLGL